MFLDTIKIIQTSPCHSEEGKFTARTKANLSIAPLLPYLNQIVEKPVYQPEANALLFRKGKTDFTIQEDIILITNFANFTEAHEILDWLKDLINDTYEKQACLIPDYREKKAPDILEIYQLLPKTNCNQCGEPSCMAFAAKLNKKDAQLDGCAIIWQEEYAEAKEKLVHLFSGSVLKHE